MSYLQLNMDVIKNYKSYLYKYINEKTICRDDSLWNDIKTIDTRDDISTIEVNYQSSIIRLNSTYHPLKEAEKWVEQFEMKNLEVVGVMFGIGNGIFARELLKKLDGNILLIYEPCQELFFYVLEHYDLTDILSSSNVSITLEGCNDNEIKNLLNNYVNWLNLKSQIICIHPQYDKIFKNSIEIFYKIILDNNNRVLVNKNTDDAISMKIINNTLYNIRCLKKCCLVTDLCGKFDSEIPAIIVAAGPSLDKNIDQLAAAKNKAVIFAVDTAVKYLFAHNIQPDFIVTLDPYKSLHHLSDERCKDIPIFSRIDSRPENFINNKRIILYNLEGYIKKIFNNLGKNSGILNSGGSVATGAFSICETMGFKRIIFVGLDLAYSDGYTHAGGKNIDASGAGHFIEMVEDVNGNQIKTRYDWYVYIRWFEDAVALFEGDEVIDATEGGAKIKGTAIMDLKSAINKYCTKIVDCDKIISEVKPSLNQTDLLNVIHSIRNDIDDLFVIKEKIQKANDICDKLIKKYKKSIIDTTSSNIKNKELNQLNIDIENKDVYELVDWDIARATSDLLGNLYIYTEDEQQNKIDTYDKAKKIYSAMEESINRIEPLLEKGLISLQNEIELSTNK